MSNIELGVSFGSFDLVIVKGWAVAKLEMSHRRKNQVLKESFDNWKQQSNEFQTMSGFRKFWVDHDDKKYFAGKTITTEWDENNAFPPIAEYHLNYVNNLLLFHSKTTRFHCGGQELYDQHKESISRCDTILHMCETVNNGVVYLSTNDFKFLTR